MFILFVNPVYAADTLINLDLFGKKNQSPAAQNTQERVITWRDPFTASSKMYGESGVQIEPKEGAETGANSHQRLPRMRLKGILSKGVSNSALLDIEGLGVFVVSKGEEIGLNAVGLMGTLKIIDVSANGVKVQSGPKGPVIFVR